MHLIFILFRYFPHGGLQRECLRVANALLKRGHRLQLICGEWRGPRPQGIEILEIPRRGFTNHAADARFAHDSLVLARSLQPDAVVGFNRMPGLDVCYSAENSFQAKSHEARSVFYRWLPRYRAFCRLETGVFGADSGVELLMLSQRQIETYRRYYKIDDRRLHLIPPSIGRDRVRPADAMTIRARARDDVGLRSGEIGLLALGSAFHTKGLDRTIEAIAALPRRLRERVRLLVVGLGQANAYRRLARRRGIADRIEFLGARDDVPRLLLGSDLLVHPARDECTGTVILEAIVAGLPVLCTANCGYSDHVRKADAGRVLPEPFEPEVYAKLLADMMAHDQLEHWSQQGARYGLAADLYHGAEVAADVIEQVAQAKRAAGRER